MLLYLDGTIKYAVVKASITYLTREILLNYTSHVTSFSHPLNIYLSLVTANLSVVICDEYVCVCI